MSSEEKVRAIRETIERARTEWKEAQTRVMELYSEIENDLSVITPNFSGTWGSFDDDH